MENNYDNLIDRNGQPHFGIFSRPVKHINHVDFVYHTAMDRPATRLEKYFSFNQFQFIGICSEEIIFGCALVDIKFIGNAFIYLYERSSGKLHEFSFMMPFAANTHLVNTPDTGTSRFKRGTVDIRLTARDNPREKYMQIRLGNAVNADITITEPTGYETLALCTPTGFNGWTYTQKAAGLDVSGVLRLHDKHHEFGPSHKGSYDWSCGFMRRETAWNWACLSGHTQERRTVGVNFASGVNETGYTENAFWIDGKMIKVNHVRFLYPRPNRQGVWKIKSDDGKVDLTFEPEGRRQEKLNIYVLATNFTQLFGRFSGILRDDLGAFHTLKRVTGFTEDHYAKW